MLPFFASATRSGVIDIVSGKATLFKDWAIRLSVHKDTIMSKKKIFIYRNHKVINLIFFTILLCSFFGHKNEHSVKRNIWFVLMFQIRGLCGCPVRCGASCDCTPLKHPYNGILSILVPVCVNEFDFDGFEKAFCHCVVSAVTFSTHTSFYIGVGVQHIYKLITRILNSEWKISLGVNQAMIYRHVPRCNGGEKQSSKQNYDTYLQQDLWDFSIEQITYWT